MGRMNIHGWGLVWLRRCGEGAALWVAHAERRPRTAQPHAACSPPPTAQPFDPPDPPQPTQRAGRQLYRSAFNKGNPGGGLFNPFDLAVKNVANTNVVRCV
jgi:hypothetical protein